MMHPFFQECTWINLHAISGVNLPGAFLRGGTPFGLNPLQAPTRVGEKKNRQQKNPKKKKSTSRMKTISNYVPAQKKQCKIKRLQTQILPKQTNIKKTATKWMGQVESLQKAIHSVRKFVLTAVIDK